MDSELSARLLQVGVATLHEALGQRHLTSGVRLLVGEPFAGAAVTVELPSGDNLGVHLALEAAPSGSVVCVGSAGRGRFGVIGELLLESARTRGVAGFLVDDAIRDIEQLRAPPAIAARGVSARGTAKRRLRREVGADVAIANTLVVAGDWIVCDYDGALVIPGETLEGAVEAAVERLEHEKHVRQRLRRGTTSREALGLQSPERLSSL